MLIPGLELRLSFEPEGLLRASSLNPLGRDVALAFCITTGVSDQSAWLGRPTGQFERLAKRSKPSRNRLGRLSFKSRQRNVCFLEAQAARRSHCGSVGRLSCRR